eukprot:SAG25_NODE_17_length_24192_cov_70.399452_13_plen_224_part_00
MAGVLLRIYACVAPTELKFAQQLGIEIVPVMMQADWKATDWLGILTAGKLYISMYSKRVADENIEQLAYQIRIAAEAAASDDDDDDDDDDVSVAAPAHATAVRHSGVESLAETKGELKRLRQRMIDHSRVANTSETTAPLPVEVPDLPVFMLTTADMKQTKQLLGDAEGGPRAVMVVGMGGVGKTLYLAWLCHQKAVREAYDQVCWLSVGQVRRPLRPFVRPF